MLDDWTQQVLCSAGAAAVMQFSRLPDFIWQQVWFRQVAKTQIPEQPLQAGR